MPQQEPAVEVALALIADQALDPAEIAAFVLKVRQIHADILKLDEDYGVIPGTSKASLWQPGAEKLCVGLRFRPELSAVRIPDGDEITYEGHCRLVHIPTGLVVAESIAVCSSGEEKYAWRRADSVMRRDDWEVLRETNPSRTRMKWDRFNQVEIPQVRTNPADVANTICRMAQKRAHVGTTKTATAASGIYTSDAEELKTAGIDLNGEPPEKKPPIQTPKAKKLSAEDGAKIAGSILPEAWDEVVATFKGDETTDVVSAQKVAFLVTAAESKGWHQEELRAAVLAKLSLELEQLPFAAGFHKLCELFREFEPKR